MINESMNANGGGLISDLAEVYSKRLAERSDVEFLRKFYAQTVYEDIQENWSWEELINELNNLDEVEDLETTNN